MRASTPKLIPDVVGVLRLQGGNLNGWGGKESAHAGSFPDGPQSGARFPPDGFGPRDLTPGTAQDALGGTMYWGASFELQIPLYFIPKDVGMRAAVFADAGSLWDYQRADLQLRDRRTC